MLVQIYDLELFRIDVRCASTLCTLQGSHVIRAIENRPDNVLEATRSTGVILDL
jgi:hypothetical protein